MSGSLTSLLSPVHPVPPDTYNLHSHPSYSRDHPVFLQLSDYFWVKNQSFYQLPYGTKGSEELLMKFLALTSSYQVPPEIERLPCRRCVVVGNGHRLRNSSLGEVINKYDVVIRLNNAPVHKYQKDSADFDLHLDNNPDSLMVLVPFKPLDIQWMKVLLNNEKRVNKGFWKIPPILWDGDPQNIRILNPYYMAVTASKILGCNETQMKKLKPKPTTGMLAITFALHFCDMVHIAGFGYPASTNKKQPIHYYETVTLKSMAVSVCNSPVTHGTSRWFHVVTFKARSRHTVRCFLLSWVLTAGI
uniref:ST3 beta-galactoside alpha-2,3-sialyltransferase 4 n=1 Tax=Leptobrachium leishanense TaxID=445787 RepID=A0A8C5Q9M6_9ANUR